MPLHPLRTDGNHLLGLVCVSRPCPWRLALPTTRVPTRAYTGEPCPWARCSLAEILALDEGAILPAPAVPASNRISVKHVQGHSSPMNTRWAEMCSGTQFTRECGRQAEGEGEDGGGGSGAGAGRARELEPEDQPGAFAGIPVSSWARGLAPNRFCGRNGVEVLS